MRAAVLAAYGSELSIEEVPAPQVAGGSDVIVRVGGAGLCRTDLHVIEGFFRERVDVELPFVLGHENAGWVEDVGPDVRSVKPGDAVIVHPVVSCGRCAACARGEEMHCADQSFPGITADGGFAEYLRTGERAVIALPEGVEPAAVAPHADAGLTAFRAARRAAEALGRGARCAVIGVGGLGHIAVQLLRELCAAEIVAVDRSRAALDLAAGLGAEHLVDASAGDPVEAVMEITGGRGADAVIDFVGQDGAIGQALGMIATGGTYWVVGYGGTIQVPAIDVVAREIAVAGSLVGTYEELAGLMRLVAEGRVTLHASEYGLDEVNAAVRDLEAGSLRGRAVIVPSRPGGDPLSRR
jgi:NAD+-dependent secondary alcohol dehydrogenase Adh1